MKPIIPETAAKSSPASRQQTARFTALFSRAGAQFTNRSTFLTVLASVCGLLVWLLLTVLTSGNVTLPGMSLVSGAFTQWRAGGVYGSSLSHANGYVNGGVSRGVAPLQCDSSGTSSFGVNLTIPPTETICGDVLVVGGNVLDQGEVRGSMQVIGGNAVISGSVTGDITVIGGNINVQPGGKVYGAAHAIGGSVIAAPNAQINNLGNDIQEPRDLTRAPGLNTSIDVGSFWLSLLFWMSAALGFSALAPEMIGRVRSTIAHHLVLSGAVGALLALTAGIVSVALVFTCLGIPLALVIIIAAWFAWVIGTVGVGAWLGGVLFGGPRNARHPSLVVSTVLGVLILSLLKALPVAGPLIGLLTGAIALGGATLTLLSARRATYARIR